jgi:hypothetical protein
MCIPAPFGDQAGKTKSHLQSEIRNGILLSKLFLPTAL